jgi:hypothetical protein
LLDPITTRPQQGEDAIRPAHVRRPRDHKVDMAAPQVSFNLWDPPPIAFIEDSFAEGWEFGVVAFRGRGERFSIAAPPSGNVLRETRALV